MNKNQENKNKKLVNLIKADLQDALTNISRWRRAGLSHFFHEYWEWLDEEIWIIANNEELKKALTENYISNRSKRKDRNEDSEEHKSRTIMKDEIDSSDWTEISDLIKQFQPVKKKLDAERKQKVYKKLNSKKGLVYWAGGGKRSFSSNGKSGSEWRGHHTFSAMENNKEYLLEIPVNHPALASFPFDQEGFCLVEPVNYNTNISTNGYWTAKDIMLDEKITITPYHDEETVNFVFKNNAKENKKYGGSATKKSTAGDEMQSLNKTKAGQTDSGLEQVKKYFLENDVKKIVLKDGKLVVTHNNNNNNNNEIVPFAEVQNNLELAEIANYFQKNKKSQIDRAELGFSSPTANNLTTPNNSLLENKYLWLAGGALLTGIFFGLIFFFRRKKIKNN